ncbi:MAG: YkgJ family cysteine cluster protein [Candidatus Bathyarchaeia archaeon]|nr:YkgJ family cysteine cluster protein [Candidatus Bathyarchaeota archaeon]
MNLQVLIPWRKTSFWYCSACGECCKKFHVPLTMFEYVEITSIFGKNVIELDLGKAYLRKNPLTKRCIFQKLKNKKWICGIQEIKPLACKLWPFIILTKSKQKNDEALFNYKGENFYIYVDKRCPNVKTGKPTNYLINKILPEVINLSINNKMKQVYSTSSQFTLQFLIRQIYKSLIKKERIEEKMLVKYGPVAQLG